MALLDANHSEASRDDLGILCDWPLDGDGPTHYSAFGRKGERGLAREALFAAEEGFKDQEDWNLLYVALTRAKRMLIVSGVAGSKGADAEGVVNGNWYDRLRHAACREMAAAAANDAVALDERFSMPLFDPPSLPAQDMQQRAQSAAIDEGVLLHGLLERVTQGGAWPPVLPPGAAIARWLACSREQAEIVRAQAASILAQPGLARFFDPTQYRFARNEMELACGGKFLRLDRFVQFDAEAWILDYKRQLLDGERAEYRAQLAQYRTAVQALYPALEIRTALILADGTLLQEV